LSALLGEKVGAGITTDSASIGDIENAKVVDKKNFADSGFFLLRIAEISPKCVTWSHYT
jgi:hypothetical protein